MTTFVEKSAHLNRNVPIGYLRSFLTLLVVAHHAALAYHPYAPPPAKSLDASMIWGAFPIVDAKRLPGLDLFVGLNDVFFMALMFFVSGIFVWASLERKGALAFIRDRAVRLGIPFLLSAAFLAPLAYYPTYLASSSATGTFWKQWLRLGAWPAGPAWFLWVLLVFGCLAAAIFAIDARFGDVLGRITGRLSTRPVIYFIVLVALSALAYLPMAAKFDPLHWSRFGPFFVQTSRILQYALYFFAGIGAGVHGLGRGLLATDGRLARRWPLWVITSLVAFATLIASVIAIMSLFSKGAAPPVALLTFANFAFVVACASLSLAALGIFSRFARNGNAIGDSLSANAYGIYLFHYAFVTWFQFALRNAQLSAFVKFSTVVIGAIAASWLLTAALRRTLAARVLGSETRGNTSPREELTRSVLPAL
jgi:hypothetical protein